ncbi:hypothetical protein P691DRAFT_787516 [Macrolepiota fuliginosa MF-IS2]|uniref:Uncharacterized protein n=1 Tax=Macrolepiota fuliginosa MF-IS2 TaxID=1400762 RepID=A0A9P6BZP1_9AGAR|nr:hypothetical protein P691DRAFT_787516 [Macrolepiota fuliginosa MF-IS2]
MKVAPHIALLGLILSMEWALIAANPIQNLAFTKRQGTPGVGEGILCNLNSQCTTIHPPFDHSRLCTDFTGDFAFLNDQLKTISISSMGCTAHENFGCSGTNFGGGVALPGSLIIDYTNFKGQDVSGFVSSLNCTFL